MNQTGSVVRYFSYDPFGKTLEGSPPPLCAAYPFMFTGRYYDSEISQYYLRARQYDTILMRFTSHDAAAGKFEEPLTLHRYLYCANDPINRIDLKGKFFEGLIGVFIGIAIEEIGRSYDMTVIQVGGVAIGAICLGWEIYWAGEDIEQFRNSNFYRDWVKNYSFVDRFMEWFEGDNDN